MLSFNKKTALRNQCGWRVRSPELRTVDTVRNRRRSSHVKRALFVDPGLRDFFETSVGVPADGTEIVGRPKLLNLFSHIRIIGEFSNWLQTDFR